MMAVSEPLELPLLHRAVQSASLLKEPDRVHSRHSPRPAAAASGLSVH